MKPNAKLCAFVMDEMAINESVLYNAGRDDVEGFEDQFVGGNCPYPKPRGLTVKSKQRTGYFLSSGPVKGKTSLFLDATEKVQKHWTLGEGGLE